MDPVVHIRCVAPVIWSSERPPLKLQQLYQSKVTWRCLRSSLKFRSSIASSISTDNRLGWTPSLPRASWRKDYLEVRKSLKIWRKKLGKSWMKKSIAIQLCLTNEVLDKFFIEKTASSLWMRLQNHYLKKSLVVGESVDSEATSISFPRIWRYTYQVSHCRIFLYYQWST